MKSHYKRAMEKLSPPADTLGKILNQVSQDASGQSKVRRFPRRAAGMAAAFCAAAVLLSAGAASAYGYFFHDIPSDVAGSLQPVQLSCTSQDITMTIQDGSMVDGTLAVYLTLEDISGQDRLADGVDFHHSYDVNHPDGTTETSYRYRSLGYDEESRTYGFLVTITPTNEDKEVLFLPDQTYTLSVGQLFLAQEQVQQTLPLDCSSLPAEPECSLRTCCFWGLVDNYRRGLDISDRQVEVLLPGSWEAQLAGGFLVSAAGFLDDGFHVQMLYPGTNPDFDWGNLVLVLADGSILGNELGYSGAGNYCEVGFYDDSGQNRYQEYIFDVSPEDLEGASLRGEFHFGGYLLDGDWEVSFRLEQEDAETDSAQGMPE